MIEKYWINLDVTITQIKTTTPAHALQNKLKANFTTPEAQELAALEGANMQTIMDVYDALRSDTDVGEWIERIQGHEWVRVVKE